MCHANKRQDSDWPKRSHAFLIITFLLSSSFLLEAQSRKLESGIDADLAFSHVKELVSFGPRPPGSPGIAQAQSYITRHLRKLNLDLEFQDFLAATPNGSTSMKNIVAKTPGEEDRVIILASHYDTALIPNTFFVGANDGGSSTGLLLELARVISSRKKKYPVWFVFFDGEEAQKSWSETDSLYGSRYFAEKMKADGQINKVRAMLLLDMIGDKDLILEKDLSSTPWLSDLVIRSAQELGYRKHLATGAKSMVDDHIPFIRAGIPAVDLIDFNFGFANLYWHTPNDTLDKISPESLKIVGEIVLRTLDKLMPK